MRWQRTMSSCSSIERSDRKRGLFVYQPADTRSALYFGSALTAAAQSSVALDKVTVDRLADTDPTQYSFVVISDVASLPAAFADRAASVRSPRRQRAGRVGNGRGASRSRFRCSGANILALHNYSREQRSVSPQ